MNTTNSTLACSGCGASLEYAAGAQALKCQYCSTITEIEREDEELDDVPDLVIPLTVEKDALEKAVYQHLASGHYTPDDLIEQAVLTKVERFYTPAYWFSGKYEARWTASFGYDRTEHYTTYETRQENGRSRQVPVTKTKTVTDWNPVNGTDSGAFSVLAYAGSRLDKRVLSLVEHSAGCDNVTDYDVSFVSGFEVEPFSVTEDTAYADRGDSQVNGIIDESVHQHAQGDRQRDWHWTANIRKEGQPVIVPVCHVTYEYEGKSYHVWTDGTNPQVQVTDELPKDEKRQRNVQLGFFPASAATVALVAAGLASEDSGVFSAMNANTLLLLAAAWGYAFWRRHSILNYSVNLRQSLLAQKTAATANLATLSEEAGNSLGDSFGAPEKPWFLSTKKDRRALVASTAVFCTAIFLTTFGHKINFSSGVRSTVADEVVVQGSPQTATPPPVPSHAIEGEKVVEVAPPEAPAATAPHDTSPELQPVVDNGPSPATSSGPGANVEPMPAVSASAATGQTADQVKITAASALASPAADSSKANVLLTVLQSAAKSDWAGVDIQVQQLKSSPPVARGDRKAARASNTEGLHALQQNDTATAIAAFAKGVHSDISDIEVRNNLGYAYLQAGDLKNAVDTLADVLLLVPDRSSAWANMADALAQSGQQAAAEASLRLTVRYSANRTKTVDFLNKTLEAHASDKFKQVAAQVLKELDSIPQNNPVAPIPPVATQPALTLTAGAVR
jgi:LSD1 subclass zinc finger protein